MSTYNVHVENILKEARFARKHDYHTYEYYKNKIYDLGLSYIDAQSAVIELAKILEV